MQVTIISVGQRTPSWIKQGFEEYVKKISLYLNCRLIEIPLEKSKKRTPTIIRKENEKILHYLKGTFNIALDRQGIEKINYDFEKILFKNISNDKIVFLIGGPEGLDQITLKYADEIWSLSKLTFPHMLTRIILIEQIYRACCQNNCHPYSK